LCTYTLIRSTVPLDSWTLAMNFCCFFLLMKWEKPLYQINREKERKIGSVNWNYLSIKVGGWEWGKTGRWNVHWVWLYWSSWKWFCISKSCIQKAKTKWPSNRHFIVLRIFAKKKSSNIRNTNQVQKKYLMKNLVQLQQN